MWTSEPVLSPFYDICTIWYSYRLIVSGYEFVYLQFIWDKNTIKCFIHWIQWFHCQHNVDLFQKNICFFLFFLVFELVDNISIGAMLFLHGLDKQSSIFLVVNCIEMTIFFTFQNFTILYHLMRQLCTNCSCAMIIQLIEISTV